MVLEQIGGWGWTKGVTRAGPFARYAQTLVSSITAVCITCMGKGIIGAKLCTTSPLGYSPSVARLSKAHTPEPRY